MGLRQHGPDAGGRGVHLDYKGDLRIWVTKDGGRAERVLEMVKCFVGIGVPGQRLGLAAQHGGEGRCEPTEQVNESLIEVGKSQESLQFLH